MGSGVVGGSLLSEPRSGTAFQALTVGPRPFLHIRESFICFPAREDALVDAPPSAAQERRPPERRDSAKAQGTEEAAIRASLPPVLVAMGLFYVVSSWSVFFFLHGVLAWAAWGSTAALGLGMAVLGRVLPHRPMRSEALHLLATATAALLVAHALAIMALTDDSGQASYLTVILAGSGFLILSTPYLAFLAIFTLGGWSFVASTFLGEPVAGPAGSTLFAGAAVAFFAHYLHRKALRKVARAEAERQSQAAALRWNEERFRAVTESAQDAILCADAKGRITYLNRAAQALWSLRPDDQPDVARLLPTGVGAVQLAAFLRAPDPSGQGRTFELTARRGDGTEIPVEASVGTWGDPDAPSFTLIVRDISARKAEESAERAAAAQSAELENLRRMNNMKTQFLNTAAHELNTPITPIRLQLHMLRSGAFGELDARKGKAVEILDRNVERLSTLVQEILDVARLQAGRLRLNPNPVELEGMLRETSDAFSETARQIGVELAVEPAPGIVVQADRQRVLQVLYNLTSNAIKFTPAGGRITVRAEPLEDHAVVVIQDTGIGLSKEQIARLFQPFTQVHDPAKVTVGGTGLGLFICKGLVEAHGGRITVDSIGPGQGAVFRFTLPLTGAKLPIREVNLTETLPVMPAAKEISNEPLARRLRELI